MLSDPTTSLDLTLQWKRLGPIALIGHRGAGKTTLGARIAQKLGRPFVDLDHYIEQQSGQTFDADRQAYRRLERHHFEELLSADEPPIIACGAGFPPLPQGPVYLWIDREDWRHEVQRSSRPPVRPQLTPEEEWRWMEETRPPRWRKAAHLRLPVPRGRSIAYSTHQACALLMMAAATHNAVASTFVTVPTSPGDLSRALADTQRFGLGAVEVRSDVFPTAPATVDAPHIASLRSPTPRWLHNLPDALAWDIDLTHLPAFLDHLPDHLPPRLIISTHPDGVRPDDLRNLRDTARQLQRELPPKIIPKYAPRVRHEADLARFFELPTRSDHPGSIHVARGPHLGWTRLLLANRNTYNYLPIGLPDRDKGHPTPLHLQALLPHLTGPWPSRFDGLLGAPVAHSQGDLWHRTQALIDGEPLGYLKIHCQPDDLHNRLELLGDLPIRGLSVTSPLKKELLSHPGCDHPPDIQALNTLVRHRNGDATWRATDTDQAGMEASLETLEQQGIGPGRALIMGRGGASHAVLRGLRARGWTVVQHLSAREGWKPHHLDIDDLDLIVHAAGSYAPRNAHTPTARAWLDLHYRDVAPPPEYALHLQGDLFFDAQARAQRTFWRDHDASQ